MLPVSRIISTIQNQFVIDWADRLISCGKLVGMKSSTCAFFLPLLLCFLATEQRELQMRHRRFRRPFLHLSHHFRLSFDLFMSRLVYIVWRLEIARLSLHRSHALTAIVGTIKRHGLFRFTHDRIVWCALCIDDELMSFPQWVCACVWSNR